MESGAAFRDELGPGHHSQLPSFRVFVYRLNFGNETINLPTGRKIYLNNLFTMDSSDIDYPVVAEAFRSDTNLQNLLEKMRARITAGLAEGPGSLLEGNSIFERIDITPLVASVRTDLSINGDNSCSIVLVDNAFSDFSISNISTAKSLSPIYKDLTLLPPTMKHVDGTDTSKSERNLESVRRKTAADGAREALWNKLSGFVIREFDFIRVEAYARIDETWQERSDGFQKMNPPLSPDFTSVTEFTGLVVGIERTASPATVPVVNVSCASMYSVFVRGTATFDKAIADLMNFQGGNIKSITDKDVNVWSNQFMGKTSLGVFLDIVDNYFFIRNRGVSKASTSEGKPQSIYMPDIRTEFWNNALKTDKTLNIVQYLPTLICYHILKYLNAEPIVTLDDLLDGTPYFMADPGTSTSIQQSIPRDKDEALDTYKPYLEMVRQGYQSFDSSYMAPGDIFNEIRSNSFFEIFEDRSGGFHFRFPRYNLTHVTNSCDINSTVSVSVRKADSAVFNTSQCQTSLVMVGPMQEKGYSPKLYMDRFSVLRFGMRVPQKASNPNATTNGSAEAIAQYLSGYNSALMSRTATVTRVFEPRVNIGDMVRFVMGPVDKMINSPLNSGDPISYVGYVTGISEMVSVSGASSQTLTLSMVRPVGQLPSNTSKGEDDRIYIPVKMAADLIGKVPPSATSNIPSMFGKIGVNIPFANKALYNASADTSYDPADVASRVNNIVNVFRSSAAQDMNAAASRNIISAMVPVTLSQLGGQRYSFKYISDPYDLPALVARYNKEGQTIADSASGKPKKERTKKQRADVVAAAESDVSKGMAKIAARVIIREILSEYRKRVTPLLDRDLYGGTPASRIKAMGEHIVRTYYDVYTKEHGKLFVGQRDITFKFPNDPVKYGRTYQVRPAQIKFSLDELVQQTAAGYSGDSTRKGKDWFIQEFNRLFKQMPEEFSGPVQGFGSQDMQSAIIIKTEFLKGIDAAISLLSDKNLTNDADMQRRIDGLNKAKESAAEEARADEDKRNSQAANKNKSPKEGGPIITSTPVSGPLLNPGDLSTINLSQSTASAYMQSLEQNQGQ